MVRAYTILILILTSFSVTAQVKLAGQITDKKDKPIKNVIIFNNTTKEATVTDDIGNYQISASPGDKITLSLEGYETKIFIVPNGIHSDITTNYKLSKTFISRDNTITSPLNFWNGAVLAFNIDGDSENNIIGSAGIIINKIKPNTTYTKIKWINNYDLMLVGNIGNFLGSLSTQDQAESGIRRVVQDAQGLNLGLNFLREWTSGTEKKFSNYNRLFFIVSYRYNSFQDVNTEGNTLGFSQSRNTIAYEFESSEWDNGGRLTFTLSPSLSLFSKKKYEELFKEEKSSIASVNVNSVLPLAQNFGALLSYTLSTATKPVFQVGIVIKGYTKE